ncbi:MAG TPA: N-acetylmuramoyl-L-alanine amidase, partial [Chthoniobacterales bacterium]|nr:N-acetylmuramoyl-L-alanine amidase [Chthoniobacterales bacterium]
VRNWLCFPVTEKDGHYLVSRVDLAKTLEPELRPQMISNLGQFKTVVLDPGHGGYDKGAMSPYGCEKDFALDVARNIKPLLEAKGLNVKMTRDSDVFVPLELRARIANVTKDSIFVSIHFNATDANPAANGFEIFSLTPRGAPSTADDALALRFMNMEAGSPVDAPSLALSMSVYHSVVGHFSEFDRGIKRARFAVLRLTKIPAILVEGGFLTQRGESRLIAQSTWRAKLAQSIATGIINYKGLVDNKTRPMMVADYRREFDGQLVLKDVSVPARLEASPAPVVIPASN